MIKLGFVFKGTSTCGQTRNQTSWFVSEPRPDRQLTLTCSVSWPAGPHHDNRWLNHHEAPRRQPVSRRILWQPGVFSRHKPPLNTRLREIWPPFHGGGFKWRVIAVARSGPALCERSEWAGWRGGRSPPTALVRPPLSVLWAPLQPVNKGRARCCRLTAHGTLWENNPFIPAPFTHSPGGLGGWGFGEWASMARCSGPFPSGLTAGMRLWRGGASSSAARGLETLQTDSLLIWAS